jgi:hypothetical protein
MTCGRWLACFGLVGLVACGARTPLKDNGGGGGGGGRTDGGPETDGGAIRTGHCTLERRAATISGGLDSFPTLARGADALMLVFTRQGRSGEDIFAVRIAETGALIGEPRSIVRGRGGTLAALLDGTTFGLLFVQGDAPTGVEMRPDTSTTGPAEAFPGPTLQVQPGLAIGDRALGFGWTHMPGTSRLFMGSDDRGRDGFVERVVEGRDVHVVPMHDVVSQLRFVTIVGRQVRQRVFQTDGTMLGDVGTIELREASVTHAVAVANTGNDGMVLAGVTDDESQLTVGMLLGGRTTRFVADRGSSPLAIDAAAEAGVHGWMLAAVAAGGPETPTLQVFGTDGDAQEVFSLETRVAAHPSVLAPAEPGGPFLIAWERGDAIEIARVRCETIR